MEFLNKIKKSIAPQEKKSKGYAPQKDIYEDLGTVRPFTILVDGQFNSFIGTLSKSPHLSNNEKESFKHLWSVACIDIDGFGNNIWNLKEGCFVIYDNDGVIVQFEKKSSGGIDKYSDKGRANFVYLSEDGNFIINQNDRNSKVFLVYISEGISERLLAALSEAEIDALNLNIESFRTKYRVEIPYNIQIPSFKGEKIKEEGKDER